MLLVALVAVAVTGPVAQASAAKLKGPKRVTPGKTATFTATGFGANKRVIMNLQPTINRGGNGFGIEIKKRFKTNSKGRATLRFKWPRTYNGCSGANGPCTKLKWKAGTRADAFAHSVLGARQYFFARTTVRVRKAPASAAARARSCRNVTITPNSGYALVRIRVRGISCKPARRKLLKWAKSKNPGQSPPGYSCSTVRTYPAGNSRRRCVRKGRKLPVIAFDTGV